MWCSSRTCAPPGESSLLGGLRIAFVFSALAAVLTLPHQPAAAQGSADQQARDAYVRSSEAYAHSNYRQALQAANDAVRLLGGTNVRLQPLIVRSLVGLGAWQEAATSVSTYFALPGVDATLAEYAEMTAIRERVREELGKLAAAEAQRLELEREEREREAQRARADQLAAEQREREAQERAAADARERDDQRREEIAGLQRQYEELSSASSEEKKTRRHGMLFMLVGGGMLGGALAWAPEKKDEKAAKYLGVGLGGLFAAGGAAILFYRYPQMRAKRRDQRQRTRLQLDQLMITSERAYAGMRVSF
jgi:hypothetical protein